jgi:hypothetical protein
VNGDLKFLALARRTGKTKKTTMTQTEVNTQRFQPSSLQQKATMAWTKQTARRSSGGKAPCKALASHKGGKESIAICWRHQKASSVPSGHSGGKSNVNVHRL